MAVSAGPGGGGSTSSIGQWGGARTADSGSSPEVVMGNHLVRDRQAGTTERQSTHVASRHCVARSPPWQMCSEGKNNDSFVYWTNLMPGSVGTMLKKTV